MKTGVRRRPGRGQLDMFAPPAIERVVEADTSPRCACGEPAIAWVATARDLLRTPYAAPRAREAYRAEHKVWYPLTGGRPACEQHRDYYVAMYRHYGHVHVAAPRTLTLRPR